MCPGGGCGGGGFLCCGGWGWSLGCGAGSVGCELGSGHSLHLLEDGLVLGFVIPFEGVGVGVAIDGVGDSDHLVEVRGETGELGQIGLVHGAGWLAAMHGGAVGVVIEGW